MEQSIAALGLLDDDDLLLDVSALILSALDHPGVDLNPYRQFISDMADRLAELAHEDATAADKAYLLRQVLHEEFGFTGDQMSYDDPDSADLIRVIDRRRGLPVSLTILYISAARRVGFLAEALNTPGHVLGRIGSETDHVLIDPFSNGEIVEPAGLASLISRALGSKAAPTAEHVEPMSNRAVLVRLLMNQASRAEAAGDARRALTLYDRMSVVAPAFPHLWWERARLQLICSDLAGARSSLSAMLETTRDAGLRSHISATLDALAAPRG